MKNRHSLLPLLLLLLLHHHQRQQRSKHKARSGLRGTGGFSYTGTVLIGIKRETRMWKCNQRNKQRKVQRQKPFHRHLARDGSDCMAGPDEA